MPRWGLSTCWNIHKKLRFWQKRVFGVTLTQAEQICLGKARESKGLGRALLSLWANYLTSTQYFHTIVSHCLSPTCACMLSVVVLCRGTVQWQGRGCLPFGAMLAPRTHLSGKLSPACHCMFSFWWRTSSSQYSCKVTTAVMAIGEYSTRFLLHHYGTFLSFSLWLKKSDNVAGLFNFTDHP